MSASLVGSEMCIRDSSAHCGLEDCVAPSCSDLLVGTPRVPQRVQCAQVSLRWVILHEDLRGSLKGQRIELLTCESERGLALWK
eukprot:5865653-Alexandrium_andersonii.AAC.1